MTRALERRTAGRSAAVRLVGAVMEDVGLRSRRVDVSRAGKALFRAQRARKRRFPWKTLLFCLALTTIGAILIPVGLYMLRHKGLNEALPFFILGGIAALPGFFHMFIFVRAWLGHRGFKYEQIPGAYDEVYPPGEASNGS